MATTFPRPQRPSNCTEQVWVFQRRDGSDVFAKCGSWAGGEKLFCNRCFRIYEQLYPQGWRGYPGDVCRHGSYTGGSGADYMCFYCENGED